MKAPGDAVHDRRRDRALGKPVPLLPSTATPWAAAASWPSHVDVRVASDRAQIGLPEVTIGIFPGWGGTQRMPRLIGPGKAKELILTGRRVGAEEALALGLVERVHPHEELLDRAVQLAADIAAKPAWALAAAKAMGRTGAGAAATKPATGRASSTSSPCPGLRHRGPARGHGRLLREAGAGLPRALTRPGTIPVTRQRGRGG